MIRILYFSTATAGLRSQDVDEIVGSSRVRNSEQNITGALSYNGRNFCQVLEGEAEVVRRLVARIEKDSRHSGFKLLDEKQIEDRHFDEWSMRYVDGLDFSTVINAMAQ